MSLIYVHESIMLTTADGIVNPVNCVGVMGKGLAKRMADRWKHVEQPYKSACSAGWLRPGLVFAIDLGSAFTGRDLVGPRRMLCFPTKDHWRQPSRLEWIQAGLGALLDAVVSLDLRSVAVPALGCGLGGLSWAVVRPMLEDWAVSAPFDVRLYPPTE